MSDAEKYKGSPVSLTGRVFQEERDGDVWALQVWTDPARSSGNTLVAFRSSTRLAAKDDYVRVQGTVNGVLEGKNAFGAALRIPSVLATQVEKIDAETVVAPALRTIAVGEAQTQHGVSIMLEKIALAQDETRIYASIENQSVNKANVYSHGVSLVQGSTQLKSKFAFDRKYPEIPSGMLPGIQATTVLVFDAVNPNGAPLQLIWDSVGTDDFRTRFESYKWQVRLS